MKPHILVIDDEELICDFLAHFLTEHGFQVTTALRAAAAKALLNENTYHLVVLDVVLKECDGLELLSEIKSTHPQLPVLMLTGLGYQEKVVQEAKRRGAAGYLSKTLTSAHLVPEISRLLKPAPLGSGGSTTVPQRGL